VYLPVDVRAAGPAVLFVLLFLFGGYGADGLAQDITQIFNPADGTWVSGPPLTQARADVGSTSVGNRVIAAGGFGVSWLDSVEVSIQGPVCLSPTPTRSPTLTRTPTPQSPTPSATVTCIGLPQPGPWAAASVVPIAGNQIGVASDGTYAYAVGGNTYTNGNRFARYDPQADTWTTLALMPSPAAGAAVVYAPNVHKLYAFGGSVSSYPSQTATRIYDITGGTWALGAPMPGIRSLMAAGYWNGKIYLVGGFSEAYCCGAEAQLWEYDPLADTWNVSLPSMPEPRGGAG
jgi:hypothetical protein